MGFPPPILGRAKHEEVMFLHHDATDQPKRRSQGWLCVLSSRSFSSPLVLLLPPVLLRSAHSSHDGGELAIRCGGGETHIGYDAMCDRHRSEGAAAVHQAGPDEVRAASCPEEQGLQLAAVPGSQVAGALLTIVPR